MEREQSKLQASLGGIREMNGVPNLLFVIDVKREALAVSEANKLGIPVIAVVDSNCAPEGIDYIIPGNDDAARAIQLYCDLAARAALDGMSAQMDAAGVDLGELDEVSEDVLTEDITLDELTKGVAEPEMAEEAVEAVAETEEAVREVEVVSVPDGSAEPKESEEAPEPATTQNLPSSEDDADSSKKDSEKGENLKVVKEDKAKKAKKDSKPKNAASKKLTEKKTKKEESK